MIFAVQGAESLDYRIIVGAFAIVVLAFKVVLDVLKWRRESAGQPQESIQTKILDGITAIRETMDRENPLTGQKLIYLPRDLDARLDKLHQCSEALREIQRQNGEILKQLDDLSSRSGVHTNPGG
jgi:hypothetical protein